MASRLAVLSFARSPRDNEFVNDENLRGQTMVNSKHPPQPRRAIYKISEAFLQPLDHRTLASVLLGKAASWSVRSFDRAGLGRPMLKADAVNRSERR